MNTEPKNFLRAPAEFIQWKPEYITPKLAAELLANNQSNRPVTARHVNLLVKEMQAGQFHGELGGIIIDETGNLADGQHRLEAIAKSGIAQWMNVARGVKPDRRKYIDRVQKNRTAGNVLHMEGYKNANVMAAGIVVMDQFSFLGYWRHKKEPMTPGEYDDYTRAFPSLQWWATKAATYSKNAIIPAGLICGMGVIFELAQKGDGDAEAFFNQLNLGVGLTEDSPVLVLRNRMIKNNYQRRENRLPRFIIGWMVVKTWNALCQGRVIKQIQVRSDESPVKVYGFEADLLPNYRKV